MSVGSNRTIENVFQEFLQSEEGKFLGQYIHNKDQLLLFKPRSGISLNGDISTTSEGRPSLLLYNLDEDMF
ncbi:11294_t:CDS:2 [Paraglomus brasilianum]|uniref:11294_t:CDS:1 n=1 Tax=Paraglomus brasilianum TaxID=144538 RepID=A0A9N8VDZ8_9GLOM|nr:11294_t:CDS:2 [Paraglomus brasilianum]